MLDVLEFIALLFQILKWVLIGVILFWVFPAMVVLFHEEPIGTKEAKAPEYQGRHWRDPQDYDKKMYIVTLINRRREGYGDIRSHKGLRHAGNG